MNAASRAAAAAFASQTGVTPSHTPEAQAARAAANTHQRAQQAVYDAETDGTTDLDWYRSTVQPKLAAISLTSIARATGVSTSAASKWRAGRTAPHARHWPALAQLTDSPSPPF